ncbi:MAG: PDZ domain-containing protein, partial [Oscillospiraceae bacterium]|nr:PDZ domain-containing protein [Oscillospiraceae bacterium]
MNKKRSGAGSAVISKLGVFVIVCVIVMAVTAFFTYKLAVGSFSDREALNNAKRYAEIEKAVEENYIGNADKETMRSAASSAMIRALGDKWSYYMTPDEYASFKMSGAGGFAGIGMGIFVNSDGRFEISSVEAASVAGKAGLTAGQVIVSVDGQDVSGMSLSGLQTLIRSKMNVNFSIVAAEKNGDEVSATLKCADSYTSPVVYKMLKEDVGYVRIKNFEAGCGDDFKTAVEFLISSGAVSFIFDVRDNPGGLFEEMTKALDLLLPDGTLYSTEDRDGNRATVSS